MEDAEFAADLANHDDFLVPSLRSDSFDIYNGGSARDDMSEKRNEDTTLASDGTHASKSLEPFPADGAMGMFTADHLAFHPAAPGAVSSGDEQYLMDFEPFINSCDWPLFQMQGIDTQAPSYSPTGVSNQGHSIKRGTPALFTASDIGMCETSQIEMDMTADVGRSMQLGALQDSASSSVNATEGKASGGWGGSQATRPRVRNQKTKQVAYTATPSSHDVQHRRMRELSELGMTLYSQGMDTTLGDDSNPLNLNVPECPTVKVLESSIKFLSLLTSLYTFERPSPAVLSPASPSDEERSTTDSTESNFLSVTDGSHPDHSRSMSRSEKSSNDGHITAHDEAKRQPVDMTEVFSLLTCYIRILYLHSFFYSKLSDFLIKSLRTETRLPPVFPGLQAGGVSLDNFGKFQIKLLVQISTHVLGEIETALGLPEGYRISKKNRERRGILDDSISVQFLEMAMKEKGMQGPRLMEEDRFASVKNRLTSLRQLLKGTINQ